MADTKVEVQMESQVGDADTYPTRKVVIPAMAAAYLAIFLIALDRTILGTAIPAISLEFKSFGDIAWYEAGFLLPFCMLQLTFGRVYKYYSAKLVLVALVTIFEIGSIVAATALNSKALIIGRAITGAGGAGISAGVLVLVNVLVPLQSRPKYLGGIGSMFGLASIAGPLLGGYLTPITWRWCFWINVPAGAVSLIVLIFVTPRLPAADTPAKTWRGRLAQLDPLGFILIVPATVCLLCALQWGGVQYPWNDSRIIALFVLFAVLSIAFVGTQAWRQDEATVPPRIFLQRTILSSCAASIGIGSLLVIFAFYLPIWFQVIQGKSPQISGLSLLPLLLSSVVVVGLAGALTSYWGYYTPLLILGGALCVVGSALISTWPVDTSPGQWIGYQVLVGSAIGLVLQQPAIAAQTVLSNQDVPIGISLITFVQFLAGSILITVCQTALENKLVSGLATQIPNFDPSSIASQGAASIRNLVPAEDLGLVLSVYYDGLQLIWYIALGLSGLIFIASFGFEWKSVKTIQTATDPEKVMNSQLLKLEKDTPSLKSKVILVTGGADGLGKEHAKYLAQCKPEKLCIAARNKAKAGTVIADVQALVADAKIYFPELDLTSFVSVKQAADIFRRENSRLDILVNNAGIMAHPPGQTKEGYEIQFGTNHMGHFLLTRELLPLLQSTAAFGADVRIISISSEGHQSAPKGGFLPKTVTTDMADYNTWRRYGQSKLANILFTTELARRYPQITSVAIHPGIVNTSLVDELLRNNPWLKILMSPLMGIFTSSPAKGVLNQIWASVAPREVDGTRKETAGSAASKQPCVKSGEYYTPVGIVGKRSEYARDGAFAKKLWEWSEAEVVKWGY